MWFNPLLDSRNDFWAVCSESAFASYDSDYGNFPYISEIKIVQLALQISSVRSTSMFGMTLTVCAEFSGLWIWNDFLVV